MTKRVGLAVALFVLVGGCWSEVAEKKAQDGPRLERPAAPAPSGIITAVVQRRHVPEAWALEVGDHSVSIELLENAYPAPPDPKGETYLLVRTLDDEAGHREQLVSMPRPGQVIPLSTWHPAVRSPSWSPKGTGIVFTAGVPGATSLWTVARDGTASQKLDSHPLGDFEPVISQDGALLFATSRDSDAEIYGLVGGKPIRLTDSPGDDGTPRFSPEGSPVAWLSVRSGHSRVWLGEAPALASPRMLQTGDELIHSDLAWSPDGRSIAVLASSPGSAGIIQVVRIADGAVTGTITAVQGSISHPAWSPDGRWLAYTVESPEGASIWISHRSGVDARELRCPGEACWLPRWQQPRFVVQE